MKKLLVILILLFMLVGCDFSIMSNTPIRQVELYLNKYQTLDKEVLKDLDDTIIEKTNFSISQREKYYNIMKKQYQNMIYFIKNSKIDGKKAVVTVEIEVIDFTKIIANTNTYLTQHSDEFNDTNGVYNRNIFVDYQLEELKNANEKIKYTLDLNLTKNKNGKWKLIQLGDVDLSKINGNYSY